MDLPYRRYDSVIRSISLTSAETSVESTQLTLFEVDFTGTLYICSSEGERKVYVCLLTCAVSRAAHLLTQLLHVSYRHYVASPVEDPSNNASAYLAAAEELQSLLSPAELAENLSRKGVEWHFIPKCTPWFGVF